MKPKREKAVQADTNNFFSSPVVFGITGQDFVPLCLSLVLLLCGVFLPVSERICSILFVCSFICSGWNVVLSAFQKLFTEQFLGEELLVTVASLISFVVSHWIDGAAIMLLYQIGKLLRTNLKKKNDRLLLDKMSFFQKEYTRLTESDQETVSAAEIRAGDVLRIQPGDYFPVNCEVLEGEGTGELQPVVGIEHHTKILPGKTIYAGTKNGETEVLVQCTEEYEKGAYVQALNAVKRDDEKWISPAEEKIRKYARVYAPFALGLTVLFSLLFLIITDATTEEAIHRALIFLVVTAPAPLLFAISPIYKNAKFRSLQKGVFVRSSACVDNLAQTAAVILDKEELLVTGQYKVVRVISDKMDPNMLLKVAAHACYRSTLPEEISIVKTYEEEIDESLIDKFAEYDGGIAAIINGIQIVIGKAELLEQIGVEPEDDSRGYLPIYMSLNGKYAGCFLLADVIREEAHSTVTAIQRAGCECIMLSSGSPESTKQAAQTAGIDVFHAQCMPLDRLAKIREIKESYPGGKVMVVGHGGNDEPILNAADIGATVCGLTSDEALQSGDAVIMDAMPNALFYAIDCGRGTRKKIANLLKVNGSLKILLLLCGLFGLFGSLWFVTLVDAVLSAAGVLYAYDRAPRRKL